MIGEILELVLLFMIVSFIIWINIYDYKRRKSLTSAQRLQEDAEIEYERRIW